MAFKALVFGTFYTFFWHLNCQNLNTKFTRGKQLSIYFRLRKYDTCSKLFERTHQGVASLPNRFWKFSQKYSQSHRLSQELSCQSERPETSNDHPSKTGTICAGSEHSKVENFPQSWNTFFSPRIISGINWEIQYGNKSPGFTLVVGLEVANNINQGQW